MKEVQRAKPGAAAKSPAELICLTSAFQYTGLSSYHLNNVGSVQSAAVKPISLTSVSRVNRTHRTRISWWRKPELSAFIAVAEETGAYTVSGYAAEPINRQLQHPSISISW